MLKQAGIDFTNIEEEDYDDPFGISTGAAVIFGATGGVMEAALRTVYEVVTNKTLGKLDFTEVRGLADVKECTVDLDGASVKVAVVHTISKARKMMELIKNGTADYAFIEVMCCPGGCIGGGGQPYGATNELRLRRMEGIYMVDSKLPIRKSHENPAIQKLYEEYLGKPLGEKSHYLLHTHYSDRKVKQQDEMPTGTLKVSNHGQDKQSTHGTDHPNISAPAALTKAPYVDSEKCVGSGKCIEFCPVNAIIVKNGKAYITVDCVECGACIELCPSHAIRAKYEEEV